jgi:hypothetical protein
MGDYNDLLKGAPTFQWGNGPRDWLFFDDFTRFPQNSTTTGLSDWFFLETAAGATQTIDYAGGTGGGVLKLLQTTNDNDVISLQANSGIKLSMCEPGTPIRFGCRFQTADVDDVDLAIGLCIQDVSIAASAPADFCMFQLSEGSAALKLVSSKGSTTGSATGIATMADATWARVFFEFMPVTGNTDTGTLSYRVHTNSYDSKWQSINLVDTFPDNVLVVPTIQVQNGSTDPDASYVDWIYAHAIRSEYVDGTG